MSGRKLVLLVLLLSIIVIPSTHSHAADVIEVHSDSWIAEGYDPVTGNDLTDDNHGNDRRLFLGTLTHGGRLIGRARIVMSFDLSNVTCPVNSARLILTVYKARNVMIRVFPLQTGFEEDEVTWDRPRIGAVWRGGDYDPAEELDHLYLTSVGADTEIQLDVTEWVRAHKLSFPPGLILDFGGSVGNATLHSSESLKPPRIEVICAGLPPVSPPLPSPTGTTTGTTPPATTSTAGTSSSTASSSQPTTSTSTPTSLPGDFYIKLTPNYVQLERKERRSVTIDVGSVGASVKVRLDVNCPPALSCSLSIREGRVPFSSTLTLTASGGPGRYQVRVRGESTSARREGILAVEVVEGGPKGYFTLSISPALVTVRPGEEASFEVKLEPRSGFSGMVELRVRPRTAEVDPSRGTPPFTARLRVRIPADAKPGILIITVRGSSDGLVIEDKASLVISRPGELLETTHTTSKTSTVVITESSTDLPPTTERESVTGVETHPSPPARPSSIRGSGNEVRVDTNVLSLAILGLALLIVGIVLLRRRVG